MNKLKRNRKGFSLVELIIVMAILVALVAVLAPQFVKYVQKARNTTVMDAANQALSMVKSEYAMGDLRLSDETAQEATITVRGDEGHIAFEMNNLTYQNKTGDGAATAFEDACGIDRGRDTHSNVAYKITLTRIGTDDNISEAIECGIDVEMEKLPEGALET